jgi:serine O-acetyltransferase
MADDENKDTNTRYPAVEEGVTIFSGTKIIGPITIGKNSIVGANSVVSDSFPENSVIVGVPARLVGERKQHVICKV